MPQILTFGEIMLRLNTPGYLRFSQADRFEITFGGAEANVAVALAGLGESAGYVTRLPPNDLADRALAELRGLGVDVSRVVRGGDRLGVYFVEQGVSQRPGKVIYDRAHSALAEARPGDFDWDAIFAEGVQWFHWSGITPALSASAAATAAAACQAARRHGASVSFDLNYRAKLWSCEQAGATLAPLMQYVDLCITSPEEARNVFGLDLPAASAGFEEAAARGLIERFGFKSVALTLRQSAAACSTDWGAMLYTGGVAWSSRRWQIEIVDRLGAGDSFTAGLIFALRRGDSPQQSIDFAVAASTLKHTIHGDYNRISLEEVEALAAGENAGRVRR